MWPQAIVSDPGSRAGLFGFIVKKSQVGHSQLPGDPDSVGLDGTPNVHFEKMFQFEMEAMISGVTFLRNSNREMRSYSPWGEQMGFWQ